MPRSIRASEHSQGPRPRWPAVGWMKRVSLLTPADFACAEVARLRNAALPGQEGMFAAHVSLASGGRATGGQPTQCGSPLPEMPPSGFIVKVQVCAASTRAVGCFIFGVLRILGASSIGPTLFCRRVSSVSCFVMAAQAQFTHF